MQLHTKPLINVGLKHQPIKLGVFFSFVYLVLCDFVLYIFMERSISAVALHTVGAI